MSAPASLPVFGDAYLADTQHLTLEEHGAYFKLLLICWRTENCELPLDEKRLATMLGVTAKKWAVIGPTVMAFWTQTQTGWQQNRLTKERRRVEKSIKQKTCAANAQWEAKRLKSNASLDAGAHAESRAGIDAAAMPLYKTSKREVSLASVPETTRDASRAQPADASPPNSGAVRQRQTPASDVLTEVMRLAGMVMPPNDCALVQSWLAKGADPEKHIYPAVRKVAERCRQTNQSIRSMRYLDGAVLGELAEYKQRDEKEMARFNKTIAMYGPPQGRVVQ